jgi:hypothetical protein
MKINIKGIENPIDTDFSIDPNTPFDDPNTPPFAKSIASYSYSIFGRSEGNKFILLYASDGSLIGRLSFTTAAFRIPSALVEGVIYIGYVDSDFDAVISFLREETNKFIIWINEDDSRISTGIIPVG